MTSYLSEETMIYKINEENVLNAVEICLEKPHYSVLIVTKSMVLPLGKMIVDCIGEILPRDTDLVKFNLNHISFYNGSHIDAVRISNGCRSRRAHMMLVDDKIDSETIERELLPRIRKYKEDDFYDFSFKR